MNIRCPIHGYNSLKCTAVGCLARFGIIPPPKRGKKRITPVGWMLITYFTVLIVSITLFCLWI